MLTKEEARIAKFSSWRADITTLLTNAEFHDSDRACRALGLIAVDFYSDAIAFERNGESDKAQRAEDRARQVLDMLTFFEYEDKISDEKS